MIPKYKIEIYDPTPALRYTIESNALNIRTDKVLTSNVGTFSFAIPTMMGGNPVYHDIALFDTAKFYFGYDTVDATPSFVGKVYQIHGTSTKDGIFRIIKGRDQGEVLLRRFKGMKDWVNIDASVIATELANDLGLGTGDITADTTDENHRIDIDKHERYFDFLQKVSDYWKDAGSQVKKDFHVDADNDLVWGSRPYRTVGVETLTVGDNIRSYGVVRDLTSVKNKIWVYGKHGKPNDSSLDLGTDMATPEPGDTTVDAISASGQKVLNVTATASFSEDDEVLIYDWGNRYEKNTVDTIQAGVSLTMVNDLAYAYQIGDYVFQLPGWTPGFANVTLAAVNGANEYKVGARAIEATAAAASDNGMTYMPLTNLNMNYYPRINFWAMSKTDASPLYIRLDDVNFNQAWYYTGKQLGPDKDSWSFFNIPAGRDNETGWEFWAANFDWSNIFEIAFVADDVNDGELIIDGFYLGNRRFGYTSNDATSQTNYGIQEMVVVDDDLSSDADCQRRGAALLYQLKDPVVRVDIETLGNTNILVGDQLSLTIPAENISAVHDVIKVTQAFSNFGWVTLLTALNTSSSRRIPSRSNAEYFTSKFADQRDIGRGLNLLK